MTGLFDYDTSWLNPALKLVIAGLFLIVTYGFYRARRLYVGDLHRFFTLLLWMGITGAVAALLRYFGHGTDFGFTKEYSLKWFQSLGYVVQVILFILAARQIANGITPEVREMKSP